MATMTAIRDADTILSLQRVGKMSGSPPSKEAGTTIARMVLSALAETKSEASGLNLSAVGGKLCALRIFRRGWSMSSSFRLLQVVWAYRKRFRVQDAY